MITPELDAVFDHCQYDADRIPVTVARGQLPMLSVEEVYQRALVRADLRIYRMAAREYGTPQYNRAVEECWDLYIVCKAKGYLP